MAVNLSFARKCFEQVFKITPCLTSKHTGTTKRDDPLFNSCRNFTLSQQYASVDPPKRPVGAFLGFFMDNREKIQQQNPNAKSPTLAKIAAQMWREYDVEKKNQLVLESRQRMEEYRKQLKEFLSSVTEDEKLEIKQNKTDKKLSLQKKRRKAELRKLGKPKLKRTPMALYLQSLKGTRGGMPFEFYMKNATAQWKNLPQHQKDIYYQKAQQDRERYFQEITEWEKKMTETGHEDLVRGYKKAQAKAKKSLEKTSKTKKKTVSSRVKKSTNATPKTKSKRKQSTKATQTEE
ncbi:hypothetical protein SNE40_016225 [Patella caerulea]|uniref:HMG box domain-containing protein n=1 Tax=Patella caerulea TaxID=87958 RepID=A0AAN8P7W2_PATCE